MMVRDDNIRLLCSTLCRIPVTAQPEVGKTRNAPAAEQLQILIYYSVTTFVAMTLLYQRALSLGVRFCVA